MNELMNYFDFIHDCYSYIILQTDTFLHFCAPLSSKMEIYKVINSFLKMKMYKNEGQV